MKITFCGRALFIAVALLLLTPSSAETLEGRVVAVADGDTITVLDDSHMQWRIRLLGIDAPERGQAFGGKSRESLSSLVFGREVLVEFYKKDRYGRTVGKVTVNGIDANLAQVHAGMAWHYKKYQNDQSVADRSAYADAEAQARSQRLGLWSTQETVAPWVWREQQRRRD